MSSMFSMSSMSSMSSIQLNISINREPKNR